MKNISLSHVLFEAKKKGYAVPAINVFNYESIRWALEAANEERMPIILQYVPKFEQYISSLDVASIIRNLSTQIDVPVILHLDHAHTKNEIERNISNCNSVMVDGSGMWSSVNITDRFFEKQYRYFMRPYYR